MEHKTKIEIEFPIHASPSMLFQYFATPDGLSEWFADNVNSRGEIFTFIWDGSEEQAKVIKVIPEEKIRFRWLENEDDGSYFEFRIEVDDLTKDVSLIVTDFPEEDEEDESKMFWENQISQLKHTIGA
jgi:uncharacterized protein YndB with AHSA1/START domain